MYIFHNRAGDVRLFSLFKKTKLTSKKSKTTKVVQHNRDNCLPAKPLCPGWI